MRYLLLLLFIFTLSSCDTDTAQAIKDLGLEETPVTTPVQPGSTATPSRISLYWENTTEPHPERKSWSDTITAEIEKDLSTYNSAKDISEICPKYKSLKDSQKVKAIGELFVAMSYYESGFNPKSLFRECNKNSCIYSAGCQKDPTYGYCMKGGSSLDGGIVISRGLLQMSFSSAKNGYGCDISKPDDLHDPLKNLKCANKIMLKQINRSEKKITASSNYWAVIKSSYSKNKISAIKSRVLKYASFCK